MSDPRLDWYQRLWLLIRHEADAASRAKLFISGEDLHLHLVGAAIEHLLASCEEPADLATALEIIRKAEALALKRWKFARQSLH